MARKKTADKNPPASKRDGRLIPVPDRLLADLRALIQRTREGVAQSVNSALVLLYWQVGERIRTELLKEKRAAYGEQIVATVSRQLGWRHFVEILPLPDPLQREFYSAMCRVERWSVRALREKIQGMLYERTALSRKSAELARKELAVLREEDTLSPDLVFRDPYFLDFLQLVDAYSENDLEAAILAIGLVNGESVDLRYVRRPFVREPDFGGTSVNYDLDELLAQGKEPS